MHIFTSGCISPARCFTHHPVARRRRRRRQVDELTADLHKRSGIPKHVEVMIRQFPKDMHAMSMFGAALFAMQVSGFWGVLRCVVQFSLFILSPTVSCFLAFRCVRSIIYFAVHMLCMYIRVSGCRADTPADFPFDTVMSNHDAASGPTLTVRFSSCGRLSFARGTSRVGSIADLCRNTYFCGV